MITVSASSSSILDDVTMCHLLEALLSAHGFKWYVRKMTDACPGDCIESVRIRGNTIVVKYKSPQKKKSFMWSPSSSSSSSVFGKSVAKWSKMEIPSDLKKQMPFVHARSWTDVQHFDWEGNLVPEGG